MVPGHRRAGRPPSANDDEAPHARRGLCMHRLLERQGVLEEMKKAGVKYGDLVHVGDVAFGFEE